MKKAVTRPAIPKQVFSYLGIFSEKCYSFDYDNFVNSWCNMHF